jgi:hypothetical protein
LTTQTYEPGDGYRYPLYYNPATGGYIYYPSAPVVNQTSSAPYLTTQTYEPGDGYRYPLYYNAATSRYIYYTVSR